jgi:hypothetical protein
LASVVSMDFFDISNALPITLTHTATLP